jgi:hypothetical protein
MVAAIVAVIAAGLLCRSLYREVTRTEGELTRQVDDDYLARMRRGLGR